MVDTRGVVRLGMPGNEKPKMGELGKFLTEYCKLWRSIGYNLGLEDAVLDMIQGDHLKQRECFTVTLQKWLEQDVRPTWNTLELAITNSRREVLGLQALPEMPFHDQQPGGSCEPDLKSQETTSDLSVHFSSFVMTIRKILEKCKDKLEECKELCSNLTISGNSDVLLFSDEQLVRINECKSFQQLFIILRKHWNWKEYSILKTIIVICNSEEAEAELNKFEKLMGSYCGMKLISDKYLPNELPVNYVKLCITVDKPYKSLTLQDFDELRTFIFEHLDVQKYIALPFIKFLFSSLHLEWYIPMQAVSHIIKAVHQNEEIFVQKSIVLVRIEDKNILDVQKELSQTETRQIEKPVGAHISFPISKEHDHLICPVCNHLFRNPKYLCCYHSYCEECLEKIQERSMITCPECRNEAMIPDGGVKHLPNNYFINHLINKLILNYTLENEAGLKCEHCDGDNLLVAYCTDCKLFLCCYCKESHKYSKGYRSHNLISLVEMRSNKDLIQSKCKFPTCQEHNLELEYYCESCEKLVCVQCTREHKGHKCDVVKNVANECQNTLKEIAVLIEVMMEYLSKSCAEIDDMKTTIKQQGDEISKEIDLYYDEAVQKLLKQKEQVKRQVHDTVLQKQKALTMQLEEVMSTQERTLNVKRVRDTLQTNSDLEVVSAKHHLMYSLKNLSEKCKQVGTQPIESANIKVTHVNEPLPQIVEHFATIDSLSFKAKDSSSLEFVQRCQIGALEIVTKDSKGEDYSRGGCEIAVQVEPMTNEEICVETADNNDGTYTIYFVAQQIGEIKLSVFMNGCEITDSPFKIMVEAPIYHDGIACSNDGMWAVADRARNCVRIFDNQDSLIKKFGSRGSRNGQFNYPCDVAFDDCSELYVADSYNHRVQKFDIHGTYLLQFGGKGTTEGQLNHPVGITTHQDKVYIADCQNNRISVFQNDGKFCAFVGEQQLSQSFDIAININSEILAADWGHHCIYVFSIDGHYINDITLNIEDGVLELKKPCSLTTDSDGSILITDLGDHHVSIFDELTGDCICCFGSKDDESDHPHGIAVGPDGNIYVSNTINRGVQIFPAQYDNWLLNLIHAYFVDYSGKYKLPLDL